MPVGRRAYAAGSGRDFFGLAEPRGRLCQREEWLPIPTAANAHWRPFVSMASHRSTASHHRHCHSADRWSRRQEPELNRELAGAQAKADGGAAGERQLVPRAGSKTSAGRTAASTLHCSKDLREQHSLHDCDPTNKVLQQVMVEPYFDVTFEGKPQFSSMISRAEAADTPFAAVVNGKSFWLISEPDISKQHRSCQGVTSIGLSNRLVGSSPRCAAFA